MELPFGLRLGDPAFLLLLVPLAVLVLWSLSRPRPSIDGGSEHVLGGVPSTWRTRTTWLPGALLVSAAVLLVLAQARPLRGRQEARVTAEGIDILLVVDVSSSMLKAGLQQGVSNLDVVKAVVSEFVKGRATDRIGLTTFAVYPRTVCPLTLDSEAVLQHLATIECVRPQSEEDGTAIGVGLGHAADKLRTSDARSKVIVLLTDGEENRWTVDPHVAAELCKDLGLKVYAVAAGRHLESVFGRVVEQPLDTRLLEDIAATTGGRFFRAKDAGMLAAVYEEIDRLETTERQDVRYTDYDDLYAFLLVPAAALLLVALLLRRGTHLELAS